MKKLKKWISNEPVSESSNSIIYASRTAEIVRLILVRLILHKVNKIYFSYNIEPYDMLKIKLSFY